MSTQDSPARADTRQNLILSALHLFARDGIDAVSMRTINNAAGARNASAVHYHFGSKLGIIEAIIDAIKEHLDAYREEALQPLEQRAATGDAPGLRDVMSAVYEPYVRLKAEPDFGNAAIRFMARCHTDLSPEVQVLLNRDPHDAVKRIDALLARALPDIDEDVRRTRYLYTWTLIVHGLATAGRVMANTSFGDMRPGEQEAQKRFFDYLVGGMLGNR